MLFNNRSQQNYHGSENPSRIIRIWKISVIMEFFILHKVTVFYSHLINPYVTLLRKETWRNREPHLPGWDSTFYFPYYLFHCSSASSQYLIFLLIVQLRIKIYKSQISDICYPNTLIVCLNNIIHHCDGYCSGKNILKSFLIYENVNNIYSVDIYKLQDEAEQLFCWLPEFRQ